MRNTPRGESNFEALAEFDAELDSVFDVLSDARRRFALGCLREYATPLTLRDVANELAVWEQDAAITDVPAEEFASIQSSLHHRHIPKMEDVGLVEYSQGRDVVTLAEAGDELASGITLPAPTVR